MGVRSAVVVALAAWVGWLLFRGVVRRRVPWVGVAVIAVPLVALFWTERQWVSAERTFSSVARSVAPGSGGVHCQRMGEAFVYAGAELGRVQFSEDGRPDGPAMLTYETCQRLSAYLRSSPADHGRPSLEQVVAVHVLSHEAWHLAGVTSESTAECRALQSDAAVAQQLGASPAQARGLARTYLTDVYPRMPSEYLSRECRDGGRLDQTPDDGAWP
jgi:hypothetical protein